jgi:hypothetical protein
MYGNKGNDWYFAASISNSSRWVLCGNKLWPGQELQNCLKDRPELLIFRELSNAMQINVVNGRMVLGTSSDNLTGYDLMKTKEITDMVMKQMASAKNTSQPQGLDSVIATNSPSVVR